MLVQVRSLLGRAEERLTVVQAFGGCRPQCRYIPSMLEKPRLAAASTKARDTIARIYGFKVCSLLASPCRTTNEILEDLRPDYHRTVEEAQVEDAHHPVDSLVVTAAWV